MSIYAESSLGTADNKIDFNIFTVFPIYRVISRQPQQRNIRDLDIPIPFNMGIADFETLIGRYAYVIEGIMYPGTEAQYDSGIRALRKLASLDVSQADALSDYGYVPYVFTEYGGATKQILMKVLYVDVPENTRKGLVQPFRLVCKIKDPTILGTTQKTATTQGQEPGVTTGSAIYPFEYSIIYGAATYTVSATAINNGDLDASPATIEVYGPVSVPRVTNTTTGEYIEVNTNLSTTSNVLRITYDKDSVSVEADGVSVLNTVSSGSTYFKLSPGGNVISLTGSSIGSDAYTNVKFYDQYPLS